MSADDLLDECFESNLRTAAAQIDAPSGPSSDLRRRCMESLTNPVAPSPGGTVRLLRRPALLSTLGLAASIALAVVLIGPGNGGPSVEASTILNKLHQQMKSPQLLEITMKSISIEEVSLNGHVQISNEGIGGDVHLLVNDSDETVEIDVSLGLSSEQSWVLIRKLNVSEPDVQPILNVLFPPGAETLLILPEEIDIGDFDLDIGEALEALASDELVGILRQMIENQSEIGATVKKRADGKTLLTLPIEDASALNNLLLMAARLGGEEVTKEMAEGLKSDGLDDEDIGPLLGSTLEVLYDANLERVDSFMLKDFGAQRGTISVRVGEGKIDAGLLDASRVTGPNTRTFDLSALAGLIEGWSKSK